MNAAATKSWALLVGINYYVKDPCLGGCVRDVRNVASYLTALRKHVKIITLTASSASTARDPSPVEDAKALPTTNNLTSHLKAIIKASRPGDSVYIHYSGHGTRIDIPNERKDSKMLKLALVLYESKAPHRSYLRGASLSKAIQKLVENGVAVTLVLDCCFSGSIQRGSKPPPTTIRTTEYVEADDVSEDNTLSAFDERDGGEYRESRVVPKWLVDPKGYVVLTACGPHETAEELILDGQERAGALSHFLIESLGKLQAHHSQITPHSLYQHLRTRFHVEWPQQVPMHYGKRDFPLFGIQSLGQVPDLVPVFVEKDVLYLGAGQAQGVQQGDEYMTFPFEAPDNDSIRAESLSGKARVRKVHAVVSELEEVSQPLGSQPIRKAKLLTRFPSRSVPVRLKDVDPIARGLVLESTTTNSFFHFTNDAGETHLFSIEYNACDELIVKDGAGCELPTVPGVPLSDSTALQRVVGFVEHLSHYKYLQSIQNRTPALDFESCFAISSKQGFGEDGFVEVEHESDWSFKVQNLGKSPLYVTVFDFTESWQVFNMISDSGESDFMALPPGGEEEIELTMKVPQHLLDRGLHHCEDLIKFIVTSKETSFAPMGLPPLLGERARSAGQASGKADLIRKLCFSLDDQLRGSSLHNWATRDFLIRTSKSINSSAPLAM